MKKYILLVLTFLVTTNAQADEHNCFIAKENNKIIKQEGDCDARYSPYSTFKIAISLMGYDQGTLVDETTPPLAYDRKYKKLFEPGSKKWRNITKVCEKTINPAVWMNLSCVWYSQAITQQLGIEKFQDYLKKFNYGNQDASGDPEKNNGLTHCWISNSLKISPKEQVEFLEKLMKSALPVSKEAQEYTRKIIRLEDLQKGWKLYGKTGSGTKRGWFVGWIQNGERYITFAHYIEKAEDAPMPLGLVAKEEAKQQLMQLMSSDKS